MKKVFRLKEIELIDRKDSIKYIHDEPNHYIEPEKKKHYKPGDYAREQFNNSLEKWPPKEIIFTYQLKIKVTPDEKLDNWMYSNEYIINQDCTSSFECQEGKKFLEIFENSLTHRIRSILADDFIGEAKLML